MSIGCEKTYPCKPHETCPSLGFQDVLVCVPVEVKPFAELGRIKTECLGKPMIHRGSCGCEGKIKETCRFSISQKIRVEVPVAFGARTEVGEARIACKDCEHNYPGSSCERHGVPHCECEFSDAESERKCV